MSWIRPTSPSGMHRFLCDWHPVGEYTGRGYCTTEFRSASVLSVLADQLRIAGWSIVVEVSGMQPRDVKGLSGDIERRHYCPAHKHKQALRMPDKRNSL